ncbi:hypothetical protein AVEN_18518-1 [Araneus ventricosus]|uniref:Uncharacterized protein n=1 Tax=Araneus ventricosus TaxID=182803 RepID=A0A4Y2SKL1_ARAVE|nr:hypothetical protein AVEN_18518-1 [Araneus ventricosus]
MAKNQDLNNPQESEEEDVSADLASHVYAGGTCDLALRYVEQYAAATTTHVVFAHHGTSHHHTSSIRQKKIIDFVPTNQGSVFILKYQFKLFL